MPYGAVMATGAASQLSVTVGLSALRLPLLVLAIAQVLLIPVFGRARGLAFPVLARRPGFGMFTVSIGLVVLAVGLAAQPAPAARVGAGCALVLGWLSTLALFGLVVARRTECRHTISTVDGTWFLAPAALLADAIASATLPPRLPWLALVACGLGTIGYLTVLALAAAGLARRGPPALGTTRSPWWISAGCGGLAAAAIGRTAPLATTLGITHGIGSAALVAWMIGSVLLVAVLLGSAHHLWVTRAPRGLPPWPPTFSMGVYALGTSQVGRLWQLPAITTVAAIAAAATLLFWAYTIGPHAVAVVRALRERP